jgi:transcriptional regulator NrdR family protein
MTPRERRPGDPGSGIPCPRCGQALGSVTDTRHGRGFIRRRRECGTCGFRASTRERLSESATRRGRFSMLRAWRKDAVRRIDAVFGRLG